MFLLRRRAINSFVNGLVLCFLVACNSSDFSGGGDSRIERPRNTQTSPPNPSQSKSSGSANSAPISNPDAGSAECIPRVLPLRVMLALDVSSSMDSTIETVKNSLVQFGQELRNIVPNGAKEPIQDLEIGLVTFTDSVKAEYQPTSDMGSLSSQIRSLSVNDDYSNIDMPEGGLTAARRALELMLQKGASNPQDAVTLLVIVTDDFAHDGGAPSSRNFTSPAVEQILASRDFRYFRLFDASPQNVPPARLGEIFSTAKPANKAPADQWEDLRQSWRRAHNNTAMVPGGALGFPPSSQTLLMQIPQTLQKSLRVCQ